MTVQADFTPVQVTLTTGTDVITVPNYVLLESELKVIRTRSGTNTTLTLNSHYTVTGEGDEGGCTVTMIGQTAGDTITIYRNMSFKQENDLLDGEKRSGPETEKVYDRLTMQDQQLKEQFDRCIRLPEGEDPGNSGELPDADSRKGKVLTFDPTDGLPTATDFDDIVVITGPAREYGTVSAMQADSTVSALGAGQSVLLKGYYASGDFGQPVPLIIETSTGGVKSHLLADGRYANLYADRANLGWFGCKFDGSDDSSFVSAAFNSSADKFTMPADKTTYFKNLTVTGKGFFDFDLNGGTIAPHSSILATQQLMTITCDGFEMYNGTYTGNVDAIEAILGVFPTDIASDWYCGAIQVKPGADGFNVHHMRVLDFKHVRYRVTDVSNTLIEGFRFCDNYVKGYDIAQNTICSWVLLTDINNAHIRGGLISNNYVENCNGFKVRGSNNVSIAKGPDNFVVSNNHLYKQAYFGFSSFRTIFEGNIVDPQELRQFSVASGFSTDTFCITQTTGYGTLVNNNIFRGYRNYAVEIYHRYDGDEGTDNRITDTDESAIGTIVSNNSFINAGDILLKGLFIHSDNDDQMTCSGGTITGNVFHRTELHLSLGSTITDSTPSANYYKNWSITGNSFYAHESASNTSAVITLNGVDGCVIANNILERTEASTATTFSRRRFFIYDIDGYSKNLTIEGNRLSAILYIITEGLGSRVVRNNTVTDISGRTPFKAIFYRGTSGRNVDPSIVQGNKTPLSDGWDNPIAIGTQGWTATVSGTGAVNEYPAMIQVTTGATASSTALARVSANFIPRRDMNFLSLGDADSYLLGALWAIKTSIVDPNILAFSYNSGAGAIARIIFGKDVDETNIGLVNTINGATSGTLTTGNLYKMQNFQAGDDFANVATVNVTGAVFTATGTTPTDYTNGSTLENLTDGGTQTSGALISGKVYKVVTFVAGDDFDNVANINVDDSVFEATGTTPTTWTNSSQVDPTIRLFGFEFQGRQVYGFHYDGSTVEYTASAINLNGNPHRVDLSISSAGGEGASLSFFVDGVLLGSIYDIGSWVKDVTTGPRMFNGIHYEAQNGNSGAANILQLTNTRFIDMEANI
jgi:hypothetical protein